MTVPWRDRSISQMLQDPDVPLEDVVAIAKERIAMGEHLRPQGGGGHVSYTTNLLSLMVVAILSGVMFYTMGRVATVQAFERRAAEQTAESREKATRDAVDLLWQASGDMRTLDDRPEETIVAIAAQIRAARSTYPDNQEFIEELCRILTRELSGDPGGIGISAMLAEEE